VLHSPDTPADVAKLPKMFPMTRFRLAYVEKEEFRRSIATVYTRHTSR
jgi:hypothetical protein